MAKTKYEHKYKLQYEFKPKAGEFTAEEVRKSGLGGTDAILMFSCIYPEDGSLSVSHSSFDGRNDGKPMVSSEVFKMWLMMGRHLSQAKDLDGFQQDLAAYPIDNYYKMMKGDGRCDNPACAGGNHDH